MTLEDKNGQILSMPWTWAQILLGVGGVFIAQTVVVTLAFWSWSGEIERGIEAVSAEVKAANSLLELRIVRIESSRYTMTDAKRDRDHLEKKLDDLSLAVTKLESKVPEEIPPHWFRAEVADTRIKISGVESRLLELASRIDRLEKRILDNAK